MNAALQEHLPRSWARTSIVLVIVGVAAAWLAHGHGARSRKERAPAPITESSAPKAALEPVVARQKIDLEATIMQRLHAIGEADPAAALALAFEGNARFPASADAPERGWIICRSLVELRRFPEAVAEARVVVEQSSALGARCRTALARESDVGSLRTRLRARARARVSE